MEGGSAQKSLNIMGEALCWNFWSRVNKYSNTLSLHVRCFAVRTRMLVMCPTQSVAFVAQGLSCFTSSSLVEPQLENRATGLFLFGSPEGLLDLREDSVGRVGPHEEGGGVGEGAAASEGHAVHRHGGVGGGRPRGSRRRSGGEEGREGHGVEAGGEGSLRLLLSLLLLDESDGQDLLGCRPGVSGGRPHRERGLGRRDRL